MKSSVIAISPASHSLFQDENTRMIRELRTEISQLRERLTRNVGPDGAVPAISSKEVERLETMVADLQVAKQQTWEEKERLSVMYNEERKKNMANKVKLFVCCCRKNVSKFIEKLPYVLF